MGPSQISDTPCQGYVIVFLQYPHWRYPNWTLISVNYIYTYIYIYVAVSCKRYPPSLPYIIIVHTCGKRWDLPKFVDVLSVNLGLSRLLIYVYFVICMYNHSRDCMVWSLPPQMGMFQPDWARASPQRYHTIHTRSQDSHIHPMSYPYPRIGSQG